MSASKIQEQCRYFLEGHCRNGTGCRFIHPGAKEEFGPPRQCHYFAKGMCSRGELCPFLHEEVRPVSSVIAEDIQTHNFAPRSLAATRVRAACVFFAKGKCTKGAHCEYSHALFSVDKAFVDELGDAARDAPACRFDAQGWCSKGNGCPFKHGADTKREGSYAEEEVPVCSFFSNGLCSKGTSCPFRHEARDNGELCEHGAANVRVELPVVGRTTCTFGPGLEIFSVTPASNTASKTVLINGLSALTSDSDLSASLSKFGAVAKLVRNHSEYAYVSFLSAEDAASAARAMHGTAHSALTLHGSRTAVITCRLLAQGSAKVSENVTVTLQWYAPSRAAFAHFSRREFAEHAAAKCHDAQVQGRRISSKFQAPSSRQHTSFTAWLGNLPECIHERELGAIIRGLCGHTPSSIAITAAPYQDKDGPGIVRRIVQNFGRLESFEVLPLERHGLKRRAIARFLKAEDAVAAVAAVTALSQVPSLGNSRLFISPQYSAKISIRSGVYRLLCHKIEAVLVGGSAEHRTFVNDHVTTVRVFSSDCRQVAATKGRLERLLLGELVCGPGEKAVWADVFSQPGGAAFDFELSDDVHVDFDARRREVRVFGERGARQAAKDKIAQWAMHVCSRQHAIPLTAGLVKCLHSMEPAALGKAVGAGSVTLDATKRVLVVEGDKTVVGVVREMLSGLQASLAGAKAGSGAEGSDATSCCPVCFCDVEVEGDQDKVEDARAVALQCSHRYCGSCFRDWVKSIDQFPVRCLADGCGVALGVQEVRLLVGYEVFGQLLRGALDAHVNLHLDELQFCITPDCPQVYSLASRVATCGSCGVSVCTACRVQDHEGLSCDEFRAAKAEPDRMRNKIVEDFLTLRCPRCARAFFDFEGCFALTCSGCHAAFCGWCLADCGTDAHAHVRECSSKPPGADMYFGTFEEFTQTHRRRQERELSAFLATLEAQERKSALEAVASDLDDLGIRLQLPV